nr:JAB domain-containing protein [Pseudoalteromonas sp. T1lg122]
MTYFIDSQNRILELKELCGGNINAANVYPREVVKKF